MGGSAGKADNGFTMLEVLIALLIALLAIDVLAGSVAASLRVGHDTARLDNAVSRAESRQAMIVDPGAILGEHDGDDGDGYYWRTQVALLEAAPPPQSERGGRWARGTGLYAVTVTISWPEGRRTQRFVLRSARLGPMPEAPP